MHYKLHTSLVFFCVLFVQLVRSDVAVQHSEHQIVLWNQRENQLEIHRFRHVQEFGSMFEVSIQKKPNGEDDIQFVIKYDS